LASFATTMKRIYVVEDNTDIQELVTYLLDDAGYKVSAYGNLTDFRKQMDTALPDLIILDIMLPDGDGQVMCKEIKSNEKTVHIPVMLMSAHVNGLEMAKSAFADDFISKPFDINAFTDKVQHLAA
jgi:two-component system phosphate regulon response regulator PhoB